MNKINYDPCSGHLDTPITSSVIVKTYLSNLPIYRKDLSPFIRGLEIGVAHGYFLVGPFYKFGPLRNSDDAILIALLSTLGLNLILFIGLTLYGMVSFRLSNSNNYDNQLYTLESPIGWDNFTFGFLIGSFGGALFATFLLSLL